MKPDWDKLGNKHADNPNGACEQVGRWAEGTARVPLAGNGEAHGGGRATAALLVRGGGGGGRR